MFLNHFICQSIYTCIYLPQGLPRALLTRAAPANPAANPRAPLARVCPPNILLFVLLLPLVPPLVQGLNIWLAKYWVATPRAAPAAPASTALLQVKNQVRSFLPEECVGSSLPCAGCGDAQHSKEGEKRHLHYEHQ